MIENTIYILIKELPKEYYIEDDCLKLTINKEYELSSTQVSKIDGKIIYVFYNIKDDIYLIKDINDDIKEFFIEKTI